MLSAQELAKRMHSRVFGYRDNEISRCRVQEVKVITVLILHVWGGDFIQVCDFL